MNDALQNLPLQDPGADNDLCAPVEKELGAEMALLWRMLAALVCLGLFALLAWALLALPTASPGLSAESLARLPESGVAHPVTAVLLNFRGYDTLLEVAVLLLALVGVWALQQGRVVVVDFRERPLLLSLLRLVLPVLMVAAGYLLWIGAFAPGGAFQGGALLGGAIVLALLGGLGLRLWRREGWLRVGLVVGLAVFLGGAAGGLVLTGHLLEYPRDWAGTWILLIEAAALVSIGCALGLLFLGGRPEADTESSTPERRLANF